MRGEVWQRWPIRGAAWRMWMVMNGVFLVYGLFALFLLLPEVVMSSIVVDSTLLDFILLFILLPYLLSLVVLSFYPRVDFDSLIEVDYHLVIALLFAFVIGIVVWIITGYITNAVVFLSGLGGFLDYWVWQTFGISDPVVIFSFHYLSFFSGTLAFSISISSMKLHNYFAYACSLIIIPSFYVYYFSPWVAPFLPRVLSIYFSISIVVLLFILYKCDTRAVLIGVVIYITPTIYPIYSTTELMSIYYIALPLGWVASVWYIQRSSRYTKIEITLIILTILFAGIVFTYIHSIYVWEHRPFVSVSWAIPGTLGGGGFGAVTSMFLINRFKQNRSHESHDRGSTNGSSDRVKSSEVESSTSERDDTSRDTTATQRGTGKQLHDAINRSDERGRESGEYDRTLTASESEVASDVLDDLDTARSDLDAAERLLDTGNADGARARLDLAGDRLDSAAATIDEHDLPTPDGLQTLRQRHRELDSHIPDSPGAETRMRVPDRIPTVPTLSLTYDTIRKGDPLGSGGNADVYYATAATDDGKVELALKEPRMSGTLHTEVVERMMQEAETWQRLDDHDHVVGVVDYGSEPLPWIAMEYMDAGHLGDRAGGFDFDQKLWTAIATTKAVRHAHRRGVAHLDLKPENILFRGVKDAWDVPKVADWGLSKHLLDHSKSVEGMTVEYAAPEQFDDEYGAVDDITDVYQLGAVFYKLFTGRPPFEGKPFKVMNKIQHENPDPPSTVADVPAELDDILLRALATEKADRYESVLYLRDALQELV